MAGDISNLRASIQILTRREHVLKCSPRKPVEDCPHLEQHVGSAEAVWKIIMKYDKGVS